MARLLVEERGGQGEPVWPGGAHHPLSVPLADSTLNVSHAIQVLAGGAEQGAVEPVADLNKYIRYRNSVTHVGRQADKKVVAKFLSSSLLACITTSKRKEAGRPTTVRMSPRLSSSHRMKRRFRASLLSEEDMFLGPKELFEILLATRAAVLSVY